VNLHLCLAPPVAPRPLAARHDTPDSGPAPKSVACTDEAMNDLGVLLGAVSHRLRAIAGRRRVTLAGPPLHDEARVRTQSEVLDCAAALDQLHALLLSRIEAQRQLETEVAGVRAAWRRPKYRIQPTGARQPPRPTTPRNS